MTYRFPHICDKPSCDTETCLRIQGMNGVWFEVCDQHHQELNGLFESLPFPAGVCMPGNYYHEISMVVVTAFFS